MCGRTACTLAPADICRACGYKSKDGGWTQPKWKDPPGGQKYYQSYNVAPTTYTPVLLSAKHFSESDLSSVYDPDPMRYSVEGSCEEEVACDWVIQPMQWGIVPPWHTGDPRSVQFNTINARSDGMLSKRTYKVPLEKGHRCVLLMDGYYEWQTTGSDKKRQPYYIYFPQPSPEDSKLSNGVVKGTETMQESTAVTAKRLLTVAGLFDIWDPKNGAGPVYSYSMITVDAHQKLSWLHHRMPAILKDEAEVRAWLDSGSVSLSSAVKLIRPIDGIEYHAVTPSVGNVKYKSSECVEKYDPKKPKETAGSKFMQAWLTKGKSPKKENKDTNEGKAAEGEPDLKKPKAE